MSKIGQRYFELKEQAEYYDLDLDFETLEFIPKREIKKTWWDKLNNREGDFDPRMDIDRE